jgi:hypothetical protein
MAALLTPPGADPQQVAALQDLLGELAKEAGLQFEQVNELTSSDLVRNLEVVVVLPPDPGVQALAAATPETKFLAVGMPGLEQTANLLPVGAEGALPDQQGFLAGYLAALVTQDWRVGVISTGDSPAGIAQQQGFINGAIYYCGLCRPAAPPFVQYPVTVDLAQGAGLAEGQAAADALIAQGVITVYVAPGAGDASLLEYLAQRGVNIIGVESPPPAVQENWIATISTDWLEAVRQTWAQAMGGAPAMNENPPLAISDRNEALFSIGRQRLAEQASDELASGLIDTGVNLQIGESQ